MRLLNGRTALYKKNRHTVSLTLLNELMSKVQKDLINETAT